MAGKLVVIIGEDEYLVSETAKKTVGDGVGLEVIDSLNATKSELQLKEIAKARESFATPPFFDPRKTTWWKNVGFLPGASKVLAEEVKLALEAFAKALVDNPLPDNQNFILSGPKLLKTSVFAKTLGGAAQIVYFAAGKSWEAKRIAAQHSDEMAAELDLIFEIGATEAFVARVGTDTRSLKQELLKLRDYLGETRKTIALADIQAITSQGVGAEPELWSVTDAIGNRDLKATLANLAKFEPENGYAVVITSVIEGFFRQLCELKDAQAKGHFDEATEGQSPFVTKKQLGFLRKWQLRELRLARYQFLKLREQAVSSVGEAINDLIAVTIVRTI